MECIGILAREIRKLGINIDFLEWEGKPPTTYWIFTYIEADNNYETSCKAGVIICEGFTRGNITNLEEEKEKIINHFQEYREIADNTAVFLGSAYGQIVDTQDVEIKKIQVNIDFKEWRGEEQI